jgi:glycosyltransferase involved in cell wall biosynthesis
LVNGWGLQQRRLLAREEWQNARAFNTILVNSFFSRESILRSYGIDSKVCYLGIDTDRFVNQHKERADLVVVLGALVWHKNAHFIIRALSEVPDPKPRLIWIGNIAFPEYHEEIAQLARELGVPWELKTRIDDEELVDLLNRATMMVYAPRLEPFGFAPLEANACGLPVVAVSEGGVRETINDGVNGLLVEHEPKEMARAIERLRQDPQLARQLGDTGVRVVADKWSWEVAVDRLEQQFTQALASENHNG